MASIKSMRYAIIKTSTGWKEKTAGEILELRKVYGKESGEYLKVKDRFRCKGCYDIWVKLHRCEPNEEQLPILTHYDRSNSGGTHFQLHQNEKHTVKGCYYNDPSEFIKEQSSVCGDVEMRETGRAKLTILNFSPPRLDLTDIKGTAIKNNHSESHMRMRFGFLQETYDRYKDGWIELPVETEDGKKVKVDDLIVSPQQAKRKAEEGENSICIVIGTIKKVVNRNRGGYIHLLFKNDSHSPIFKLSVHPNHIYNEDNLKSLENRKIGCYGRIGSDRRYPQMELFSIDRQVVFMDLKDNQNRPVIIPEIKIQRVRKKIMDTMKRFNASETDLDVNHFTYYINRQKDIPDLNEQIILNENEKEKQLQNHQQIKQLIENISIEKEQLANQLETQKINRKVIENNLDTEKRRIRERLFKIFRKSHSYKVQELLKEKENLEIDVYQLEQSINSKKVKITKLSLKENEVQKSIKKLNQSIKNVQDNIQLLRQGLKWEEEWKQNIGLQNIYIYDKFSSNELRDLLIALQIVQSPATAALNINCYTQQHEKNKPTKLSFNIKKGPVISIHPIDLYVYQTLENKLNDVIKKLLFSISL
ncbi:hypothetical protein [Peribacillus frigoritolerans]|uniref:hypothetical protein n=1 Tax=Peribacillus frigoritolerans TaxID=450367 RepID=UPI003D274D5C